MRQQLSSDPRSSQPENPTAVDPANDRQTTDAITEARVSHPRRRTMDTSIENRVSGPHRRTMDTSIEDRVSGPHRQTMDTSIEDMVSGPHRRTTDTNIEDRVSGPHRQTTDTRIEDMVSGPHRRTTNTNIEDRVSGPHRRTTDTNIEDRVSGPHRRTTDTNIEDSVSGPHRRTTDTNIEDRVSGPHRRTTDTNIEDRVSGPHRRTTDTSIEDRVSGPHRQTTDTNIEDRVSGPHRRTTDTNIEDRVSGPHRRTTDTNIEDMVSGSHRRTTDTNIEDRVSGPHRQTTDTNIEDRVSGPHRQTTDTNIEDRVSGPHRRTTDTNIEDRVSGPHRRTTDTNIEDRVSGPHRQTTDTNIEDRVSGPRRRTMDTNIEDRVSGPHRQTTDTNIEDRVSGPHRRTTDTNIEDRVSGPHRRTTDTSIEQRVSGPHRRTTDTNIEDRVSGPHRRTTDTNIEDRVSGPHRRTTDTNIEDRVSGPHRRTTDTNIEDRVSGPHRRTTDTNIEDRVSGPHRRTTDTNIEDRVSGPHRQTADTNIEDRVSGPHRRTMDTNIEDRVSGPHRRTMDTNIEDRVSGPHRRTMDTNIEDRVSGPYRRTMDTNIEDRVSGPHRQTADTNIEDRVSGPHRRTMDTNIEDRVSGPHRRTMDTNIEDRVSGPHRRTTDTNIEDRVSGPHRRTMDTNIEDRVSGPHRQTADTNIEDRVSGPHRRTMDTNIEDRVSGPHRRTTDTSTRVSGPRRQLISPADVTSDSGLAANSAAERSNVRSPRSNTTHSSHRSTGVRQLQQRGSRVMSSVETYNLESTTRDSSANVRDEITSRMYFGETSMDGDNRGDYAVRAERVTPSDAHHVSNTTVVISESDLGEDAMPLMHSAQKKSMGSNFESDEACSESAQIHRVQNKIVRDASSSSGSDGEAKSSHLHKSNIDGDSDGESQNHIRRQVYKCLRRMKVDGDSCSDASSDSDISSLSYDRRTDFIDGVSLVKAASHMRKESPQLNCADRREMSVNRESGRLTSHMAPPQMPSTNHHCQAEKQQADVRNWPLKTDPAYISQVKEKFARLTSKANVLAHMNAALRDGRTLQRTERNNPSNPTSPGRSNPTSPGRSNHSSPCRSNHSYSSQSNHTSPGRSNPTSPGRSNPSKVHKVFHDLKFKHKPAHDVKLHFSGVTQLHEDDSKITRGLNQNKTQVKSSPKRFDSMPRDCITVKSEDGISKGAQSRKTRKSSTRHVAETGTQDLVDISRFHDRQTKPPVKTELIEKFSDDRQRQCQLATEMHGTPSCCKSLFAGAREPTLGISQPKTEALRCKMVTSDKSVHSDDDQTEGTHMFSEQCFEDEKSHRMNSRQKRSPAQKIARQSYIDGKIHRMDYGWKTSPAQKTYKDRLGSSSERKTDQCMNIQKEVEHQGSLKVVSNNWHGSSVNEHDDRVRGSTDAELKIPVSRWKHYSDHSIDVPYEVIDSEVSFRRDDTTQLNQRRPTTDCTLETSAGIASGNTTSTADVGNRNLEGIPSDSNARKKYNLKQTHKARVDDNCSRSGILLEDQRPVVKKGTKRHVKQDTFLTFSNKKQRSYLCPLTREEDKTEITMEDDSGARSQTFCTETKSRPRGKEVDSVYALAESQCATRIDTAPRARRKHAPILDARTAEACLMDSPPSSTVRLPPSPGTTTDSWIASPDATFVFESTSRSSWQTTGCIDHDRVETSTTPAVARSRQKQSTRKRRVHEVFPTERSRDKAVRSQVCVLSI